MNAFQMSSAKYLPFLFRPPSIENGPKSDSSKLDLFIKLTEPQHSHKFAVAFYQVHCYYWTQELYI